jgi:hypothetical protein
MRTQLSKIALAAGFGLAMTLIFPTAGIAACTVNDNTDTKHCSDGIIKQYGSVSHKGRTYKTVVIGTQTWLQHNLNYAVEGSKCYKEDDEAYCDKYGRLYNWATANLALRR